MTDQVLPADARFMKRALELATRGKGSVSPNPLVGAVVVHDDRILAEGWHERYGSAHAEVNAIERVQDKALLKASTLYVNLEPCVHYGKTPPCADLIIRHHLKRVVIANTDPNPVVSGKGIAKLTAEGVSVTVGVLEEEGKFLNRRFFTAMQKHRPFIRLKWAETSDGFIARRDYSSKWISSINSRRLVHKWRAEDDAVLVGRQTAAVDDPRLNVREWHGRNPVRVVIDRHLRLPPHLHLFDGTQDTLCYNLDRDEQRNGVIFVRLDEQHFLPALVGDLFRRNLHALLVEGGAGTLGMFIENNLWDEACIFVSATSFGDGIRAPSFKGNLLTSQSVLNDTLKIFEPL